MKNLIDPTIDCVFKAILGSKTHEPLLISFLNAILGLFGKRKIHSVEIKNPYNPKDYISGKETIVDIKAIDEAGKIYQIEVQTSSFSTLNQRMLYTWSHVYKDQLKKGCGYQDLKPVISIWLLTKNLIQLKTSKQYYHHFVAHDVKNNRTLSDHLNIHVLELPKWHSTTVLTEKEQWLYFFKEGATIDADNPPAVLEGSEVMRQAMDTLKQFSEQENNYDLYQARQAYILQQNTMEYELEQARQAKEQALQDKDQALQDKDQALQDKDQALQDKDQALQDKDQALQGKDQALQGKDQALQGKDQALQDKEQVLKEKAQMQARLEGLLKKHGIDPNEE